MRLPVFATAVLLVLAGHSSACCAVSRGPVVNADQTVIMIWDEAKQTQHFIRQANFKTDAPDVGFIVPSPSRPQLEMAGKEVFTNLAEITAPKVRRGPSLSLPIGCAAMPEMAYTGSVRVIEEKRVAGYNATVLTAASGKDLIEWLRDHGYNYSEEVAEWAKPYLGGDWHFTALKVAKDGGGNEVSAAALRISFRTQRPLFPYREPASGLALNRLGAGTRMLRIYFISDARYSPEEGGTPLGGLTAWAGDITPYRSGLLEQLKMAESTLPGKWWLTEFEHWWPYNRPVDDVYFVRDQNQGKVERPRMTAQVKNDGALVAFLAVGALMPLRRRRRR